MKSAKHASGPFGALPRRRHQIWAEVAIFLFVFANVFDMGGEHVYKYIGFLVIAPLTIQGVKWLRLSSAELATGIVLFGIWPVVGFAIGLRNNADPELAWNHTTPFSGILIGVTVASLTGARVPLRCLHIVLLMMAILVVLLTVCNYFGIGEEVTTLLPGYVSCHIDPYVGALQQGAMNKRIYLTATLWLVLAAVYYAQVQRMMLAMVCIVGLIFAVSRSGALIAVIGVAASLLLRVGQRRKAAAIRRLWGAAVLCCGLAGAFMVFPDFRYDVYESFLGGESASRDARMGHIASMRGVAQGHPYLIFVGQGTGTTFFSEGTGRDEFRMEVDHLDAVRQHGLIWFLAFTLICGWIFVSLVRHGDVERRATGWAFGAMFVAAGTNPHLITPLFLFYLGVCYIYAKDEHHCDSDRRPARMADKEITLVQ